MTIKEGLTVCFPLGFSAVEDPVPSNTLFAFYRTTDDGYQKSEEIIAECKREKNKAMPDGMAGYLKIDHHKKLKEFQNKATASRLLIEEHK